MEPARPTSPMQPGTGPLTVSMPFLIAALVVISMGLLGALLIWQGWSVARHALIADAHDSTLAMGERIDERFERRLQPGSITLAHLAHGPLIGATTLDERLTQLPLLGEILARMPAVAAVFVGYADGDFFLMRPLGPAASAAPYDAPEGATYLVQSLAGGAGEAAPEEWLFYDKDLRLLARRNQPSRGFDPRTRPWYTGALASGGQYLTQPYMFFTSRDIGLTQSALAPNRQAVVAVEQNLSELAATLEALRPTRHAELAVVGDDGSVYGYRDLSRIYRPEGGEVQPAKVADLGVAALAAIAAREAPARQTVIVDVDGAEWFGIAVPLSSFPGRDLDLLVAIPGADLLAAARSGLAHQLLWAAGLMAVLLVAGWLLGRRLGRSLVGLAGQADALNRFDFRTPPASTSRIREIRQLGDVLAGACVTIQNFLATAETIGSEPRLERMLAKVLEQTVAATGSASGAVYLLDSAATALTLAAVANGHGAHPVDPTTVAPVGDFPPVWRSSGEERIGEAGAPFSLPLISRDCAQLGLLVLRPADGGALDGTEFGNFVGQLSGALSSAIETRQLFEAQTNLLDGLVLLIADAIDAKSPYTGGHCRRVPELATMIVDRMSADRDGPFRDFHVSEAERQAFHLGAWLHDCGKVTSPEHIIDKATKLEAVHNRIHEVRARFETLWRDAEIAHLERLANGTDPVASAGTRDAERAQLTDDFAFIAQCNIGGEFMTDEAIARLKTIAGRSWLRHFDDRLGLSVEEERRLDGVERPTLPAREPLLADKPEHVVPWGAHRPPVERGDPANVYGFDMALPAHRANLGELYNLSIGRGTLTDEDRFRINDHVVQTYIMLKSLPWPRHLARVPDIAATHHERMDGKGYPRHLTGRQLSIEERVMALADIFEALTASDRPYKPPKTLSQSLRIMAFMCKEGHLDPSIFRYFLQSDLWRIYAERHLTAAQRDAVDVAALRALLPDEDTPSHAGPDERAPVP